MSKYYTPSLFIFSVLGGGICFVLLSFFADVMTAICFASLCAIGISVTIPATLALSDRRLLPLKKEIGEPILIDERISIVAGNEIKQGFIVTTSSSIFVISFEKGSPVKMEIKKDSVKKISVTDDVYINIFIDYNRFVRIFCGNCEELFARLRDEGFVK